MSAILIAQLLATFGPSAITLIDQLIAKISQNGDVSAAEWTQMSADARRSSVDILKQRVTAAGMDLNDPKVQQLLALSGA